MYFLSCPVLLQNLYRFFWIFHRLMVVLIIVMIAVHGAFLAYIGVGLWAFDLLFRMI